jgi:hypothetical protein
MRTCAGAAGNNIPGNTVFDGYVSSSGATYAEGTNRPLLLDAQGHLQVDVNDIVTVATTYADDSQLDAFQRLRVSEPVTLFDSKQLVDNQPLFWDDQITSGSGATSTYNTNKASSTLAVSNLAAGTRVRQTFERYNYQPGKSQYIALTGVMGTGHTGITKRLGYFDGYNGLFFQQDSTGIAVVIRSNTSGTPVDTVTYQAAWNQDKLNGTGKSGLTLDLTKAQIFTIDMQWLGVGRVRFGFVINGVTEHCHIIYNANINSLVYMSMPNLPLRYEISNNGTGPADSLVQICSTVISEGGRTQTGPVLSADMGATELITGNNTNLFPLMALRLKTTYQMAMIDLDNFATTCTSGATYRYTLLLNPTIVGTALSFSDITNSALQLATPANTTTVTGGTQIVSGYLMSSASSQSTVVANIPGDLRIGSNIAGVSDILVLAVQRITGTTEHFFASIAWREQL